VPDADAAPAAIKRLQLGKRSTEDLTATADRLTEMAAALVTAKGHAEGWLPPDFYVEYTRVV
jgi:hypothetical protein